MVQQPQDTTRKRRHRGRKRPPPAPQVDAEPSPELERAEALADAAEQAALSAQELAPAPPVEPATVEPPAEGATTTTMATAAPPRERRRRRGRRGGRFRTRRSDQGPAARGAVQPPQPEPAQRPAQPAAEPAEKRHAQLPVEAVARSPGATRSKKAARAVKAPPEQAQKPSGREMLINVAERDECRIAIVHGGRLEELFVERSSDLSHVGNIYKGRVTNVEPSIQAAFVDFGLGKNGFLHISDLQPQYFPNHRGEPENVGKKTPRKDRPPIQRCLRRGQEIIVQVIKEGIGTKGPTLTTYISLPGRYLVMMPGMSRLGVSRKIEDDEARRALRTVLSELELPKGMGFILRTAGLGRAKRDLQRDLNYLARLWKSVADGIKNARAPAVLYQESDLVIRTIRDVFSSDVDRIVVDDEATAERVREFLGIANPRAHSAVEYYSQAAPLFHKYAIEQEIEQLHRREVPLPSGGSIVIESTEALVAIDVNSGRYRQHDNAEHTALQTNLEAADEIARQLRLRDLGGLIICDFIDLRGERNKRAVERRLRDALKQHKERAKLLRMSQFGIIEMTRQRQRPSIKGSAYAPCPCCRGGGLVKTTESMALQVLRLIRSEVQSGGLATLEVRACPEVADAVQNRSRVVLQRLEQESHCRIMVRATAGYGPDEVTWESRDGAGRVVARSPEEPAGKRPMA